jgi:pyruvate/2-oxoglutarate dehydrogenase complex dihydrolipoamide acyltransferase (E2) component
MKWAGRTSPRPDRSEGDMAFEFKLPDLGEGIQEGEIVRWLVQEGEDVSPEQSLVEVMTEKVTAELPSPVTGRVRELCGEPGDVIQVGAPLLIIDTEEETAEDADTEAEAAPAESRDAEHAVPVPAEAPVSEAGLPVEAAAPGPAAAESSENAARPIAMPAVRRMARDLDVDLAQVSGTGPGGRILAEDVRRAAGVSPELPERRAPEGAPAEAEVEGVRRVPLRGIRRRTAEHLLDSHRNTAPYTYVEEVDFTELVRLRERVQPLAAQQEVRITFLPFIMAALSASLAEHPTINAVVHEGTGDLMLHKEQHIGLAVQTDDGLVVPVIRNVETRNVLDLAREIERLTVNAREGRLTRDEVVGGTFTVTSLGPMGGVLGTPMLNTPQVAILGVHRIGARPMVLEGTVVPRQMANLSLTFDHRYIDGYVGAEFAQSLKRYLEDPALMMFCIAELRGEGFG